MNLPTFDRRSNLFQISPNIYYAKRALFESLMRARSLRSSRLAQRAPPQHGSRSTALTQRAHARGERCPHTQTLIAAPPSEAADSLRGPYLYPLDAAHRTQLAHAHKRAAPRTASSVRRPRQGDRAPPPPRPCLATGALR